MHYQILTDTDSCQVHGEPKTHCQILLLVYGIEYPIHGWVREQERDTVVRVWKLTNKGG